MVYFFKCYFCVFITTRNCYITLHNNLCIRISAQAWFIWIRCRLDGVLLFILTSSFAIKLWFFESPIYLRLTEFCKKLEVVYSGFFSMIKYIVAPPSPSSLPIKLICCVESVSSNSICWLKSIPINLKWFKIQTKSSKLLVE